MNSVMIVDDHPVLRCGLAALIEAESDLAVCGQAASGHEALRMIPEIRPDIVIVDLELGGMHGLDLVKSMQSQHPQIPALVLTMHDETVYAERSLRAGAKGYLSKSALDATVLLAIRCILQGETYMSDKLKEQLATKFVGRGVPTSDSPLDVLTDRELQVFRLIGKGLTTREIAATLFLSVKTVESHVEHIKRKLALDSAAALARRAYRWVENGDTG